MKNSKKSDKINNSESQAYHWKRRPSEIRGFNRVIYATTEKGDYLRVDYNIKDKKVRLYLEDVDEGGNPYYSIISDGNITTERNASTGRVTSLFEKFNKRAKAFSAIPNKDVLKLINKNYGIGIKGDARSREEIERIRKEREKAKKSILEETRRKYFKPEDIPYFETSDEIEIIPSAKRRVKRLLFIDLFDFVTGVIIAAAVYYFSYNLLAVGIVSSLFGVALGIIDVYFREREPFFTKIIFFITAGVAAYIYGYYII
ncbi:MAG: hypothetical protein MUC95_09660 [Spirochaetes bacterium]|nr:hypothetical protein [Spirochaetota bacterium]